MAIIRKSPVIPSAASAVLVRISLMFFIHVFYYIQYLFIVPIFSFGLMVLAFTLLLFFKFGGSLIPQFMSFLDSAGVPSSFELTNVNLLPLIGWASLAFNIVGRVIEKLFKVSLASGNMLKVALVLNAAVVLPILILMFVFFPAQNAFQAIGFIAAFFCIGIVFSFLAFGVGSMFGKIAHALQNALNSL